MDKEILYEGKAKVVYKSNDGNLVQYFKDDATAFNGVKHDQLDGKGVINNTIASAMFEYLEENGIRTHFLGKVSPREMKMLQLEMIPIEVVVRNIAAGSLCKRLGFPEGQRMETPIVEFYLKNDDLGDPLFNDDHIQAFGYATIEEIDSLRHKARIINDLLISFFNERKVDLVDFKLEFGRYKKQIILGDEISPDTCRFWDSETGEKMDKDRFRFDLGNVMGGYNEMQNRILGK